MSPFILGIVASAQTVVGSYELISTQRLTANAASINIASIPQTYKHLELRYVARNATFSNQTIHITFNSLLENYTMHYLGMVDGSSSYYGSTVQRLQLDTAIPANNAAAGSFGAGTIDILDYSSANKNTVVKSMYGKRDDATSAVFITSGLWNNTSAVTSMQVIASDGTFAVGSRFSLYGLKG